MISIVLGVLTVIAMAAVAVIGWFSLSLARRTWMVGVSWFGGGIPLQVVGEFVEEGSRWKVLFGGPTYVLQVLSVVLILAALWVDRLDRKDAQL